ncbi:hypothetical protein Z517_06078 [Fonsecaea pedrosoi CBS 271.37]|uniref:Cyclohexanone monooxygenase n=1 Tax=Fonsecaea pedrosoi CBS 271.37 TaxID=1442368 RepID=A0A0D2DNZ2_9EURO|nr:uncharacterized protein Z517_06078 [Fonsecaea pedrosoi CBS 271.37]KIW79466.1 hypothetical protein Z517_06078 [Fonsecaea pedrosoi CBS 271.37]
MAIKVDYDALIVGAGFGGIYQSYMLSNLGLTLKVIDAAGDVGGTWYWNRYPGAMSDTESYLYRYTWDKDDLLNYPWTHHYVRQPEILKYLNHVTDRHDLRKFMQFETSLTKAAWDDTSKTWVCHLLKNGQTEASTLRVRYLVTALGLLSKQNFPAIEGLQTFKGQLTHTGSWKPDVETVGKNVGVIGTGSTGVQVITDLGSKAKRLVCFQRNAQYSVPSGDGPVHPGYREQINANYDTIIEDNKKSICGFGLKESTRSFNSFTPEEREQIFEDLWKQGNGFRFMFGGFNDLTFNREANEAACDFIKRKIQQIVKDPVKARKLLPTELYARRPLCDGGYYKQFNRDNVDVVDLRESPIVRITANGILTADGVEHELDVIIFATGFDAIEGNYMRIEITGSDGTTLQEHWKPAGPRSYMGTTVAGFPNFFVVTGPQGAFCNIPSLIESQVEYITELIAETEKRRQEHKTGVSVEADQSSEDAWVALCENLSTGSLFKEGQSWIFGANVPGKTVATRFYFGGLGMYRQELQKVIDEGFRGYVFRY